MKLLVTDADDTLWDWLGVYYDALLHLLDSVERQSGLVYPEQDRLNLMLRIDEELASLNSVRYEIPKLVYATLGILRGDSIDEAVKKADSYKIYTNLVDVDTIAGKFILESANKPPKLFPGVVETLSRIQRLGYTIIVASESEPYRCQRLLDKYNISRYITSLYTGHKEDGSLYKKILEGYKGHPRYVVGNLLSKDIKPAQELGFITIYCKPSFVPKWDRINVMPDYTIKEYKEIVDILMTV